MEGSICLHLMKRGLPMAFRNAIMSVGGMIVQFVVNGFGVLFIAGFTSTNKLYGILEVAAITHDIACPLCRKKYGNTNGKYQEQEGAPLVREFLADTGMTAAQIDRVAYLVGHHHSPAQVNGIDYQILIEADYIVNASESGYDQQAIRTFMEHTMKTAAGIRLTKTVFGV